MEAEINILKSIDLEGRRKACIQVTSSSWNTNKEEQVFHGDGFLKNLKCKISLEVSTLQENQSQIRVQQAHFIQKSQKN
jgi:hypothetical protein